MSVSWAASSAPCRWRTIMESRLALAVLFGLTAAAASAQSPSSAFPRGNSLQAWQDPGLDAVLAECRNRPAPFSLVGEEPDASASSPPLSPPPAPPAVVSTEIPGVIAEGQTWDVVWSWE